jgi:hypothetical protein
MKPHTQYQNSAHGRCLLNMGFIWACITSARISLDGQDTMRIGGLTIEAHFDRNRNGYVVAYNMSSCVVMAVDSHNYISWRVGGNEIACSL